MIKISSWGNYKSNVDTEISLNWRHQIKNLPKGSLLACGMRRSYGDSCINTNGIMLSTKTLNKFISFNENQGILHCESGVTFADILNVFAPRGWFLPVVPGTKFVTVGGAIANDIHGKNHHHAGSFGMHVLEFTLLRSNQEKITCSPQQNSNLFYATIGGLGLTGLILDAKIRLIKISSEYLAVDYIPFYSLAEFIEISEKAKTNFEYTVAWFDCMNQTGCKGIFMQANFIAHHETSYRKRSKTITIPFNFPGFILNSLSIKAFNKLYFTKNSSKGTNCIEHYEKFFFPLDNIHSWNRIYGSRGFWQYQCQIPWDTANSAIKKILDSIFKTKKGSFLAVLKIFGAAHPHALLSFPSPGITLALDFANDGHSSIALLNRLDQIVLNASGKIYPAKDLHMNTKLFYQAYPKLNDFIKIKDSNFTSDLWKRLIG